ncbi:unnamed protein product [Colias eurytheme]|nr:unnamed protein product [Colias eurytheme]
MFLPLYTLLLSFVYVEGTHIFTLEKDFNKLQADEGVANHVKEIVNKLKTFKVAVHPRIRLFYQLLKRGMQDYAQKNSDSLYNPNAYQTKNSVRNMGDD